MAAGAAEHAITGGTAALASSGLALLLLAPGAAVLSGLGWVWPPVLLGPAGFGVVGARRALVSWTRAWLVHPVCAVIALAAVAGRSGDGRAEQRSRGAHPQLGVDRPCGRGDTRVCSYDRAGLGWSDPAPHPQDAVELAGDLHTLLAVARVPGPYVLAGHSVGGVYDLVFADRYRTDVAGLVLLDSSGPEQFTPALHRHREPAIAVARPALQDRWRARRVWQAAAVSR